MYVIGKDKALQFAKENCTKYRERFIEDIQDASKRSYLYDYRDAIKEAFLVEGVTEIVDVYCFRQCTEGKDINGKQEWYWSYESYQPGVRLIESGTIASPFRPGNAAKNFGLHLLHEDIASGGMTTYFSYKDEDQPNFIGKGSRKKVEDWFGFLTRENDARRKYIDDAKVKNAEFRAKVEKMYPDARIHIVDDGWMSECEFSVGYVLVHFQAGEDGRFYRSTKVDILKFPSTDKLFSEEGE